MSVRHKALRGVFWSAAQNWGSSLISTLVFFVLAHRLSKEAFGLVALASACIGFMEIFLRQGFAQALIQREQLERGHLDTAFWSTVAIGTGMLGVGLAVAPALASLFHTPALTPVVRWLSLGFLIAAFGNTQAAVLRREMAFKVLAVRTLLASTIGGAVGVTMALLDCGVWSLVAQVLTRQSVAAVVMWIGSSWRPGFAFSRARFRELLSFGAYVMGIELLSFTSTRVDVLIMGAFLTTAQIGTYDVAYKLLRIITRVITQTVSAVALPTFSRIRHDIVQMRNAYYTATQMTAVAAFPAFVGMAVLAPDLVHIAFGAKWAASATPMRVLAGVGMLYSVFFCNGAVILACGKPAWWLYLAGAQLVAQVVAVGIAVRWGITAVAVAFAVRTYVLAPLSLMLIRRLIGIQCRALFQCYFTPFVGALAMGAIVLVSRNLLASVTGLSLRTGVCIVLGMVAYTLLIRLFEPQLAFHAVHLARLALSGETGSAPKEPPAHHG